MSSIEYDEMLMSACLKVCKIEDEKNRRYEKTVVCIPEKTELLIRKYIRLYENRIRLGASLKRVACIIIALILIGGAVLTVNVNARNKLLKIIRKEYGSTIEYKPVENVEVNSTVSFEVGWLPDGFELVRESSKRGGETKVYRNDENQIVIKVYSIDALDSKLYITDGVDKLKSELGEYFGNYYEFIYADENSIDNNLLIINDAKNFFVSIDASIDRDAIFKIVDNLKIY